jgi:hypothetical protein
MDPLVAPTKVRPRVPPLWAVVLAGPVIGTVYFWLIYLLAEAGCAEELELVDETVLRLVVLAGGVASVVLLTAFAWRAAHMRRDAASGGSGDDSERFMATTGLMLLGLFLLFVAFLALPVIGMSLC